MRRRCPASKDRPNGDLPKSRAAAFATRYLRAPHRFPAPCALACSPESLSGETLFVRASPVRETESTTWALAWRSSGSRNCHLRLEVASLSPRASDSRLLSPRNPQYTAPAQSGDPDGKQPVGGTHPRALSCQCRLHPLRKPPVAGLPTHSGDNRSTGPVRLGAPRCFPNVQSTHPNGPECCRPSGKLQTGNPASGTSQ